MQNEDDLLVVDLGELSGTHFGKSVTSATLQDVDGHVRLRVEAGMVKLDFECEKERAVGTYVVFDKKKTVMGITTEVARIKDEP